MPIKTFPVLVALALTCSQTFSQSIFAEIPFDEHRITDFDAIAFGDSILFSYNEPAVSGPVQRSQWVRHQKVSGKISLSEPVAFIHSQGDQFHYYSMRQMKDAIVIKAFAPAGNEKAAPVGEVSLREGIVMAAYTHHNLVLVIYERSNNAVSVYEIDGTKLLGEKKYSVPSDLRIWIRKEADVEFIEQGSPHINTFKGYSRVKLIHENDDLYLTLDNHMKNETLVLALRKDGRLDQSIFSINSTDDFGSYIIDGKLFTTIMSTKKFVMNVQDLTTKELVATNVIAKGTENFDITVRSAADKTVSTESFTRMMSVVAYGDPQLTVSRDSGNYTIAWGSFINDKGAGGMAGANPVAMLMTFAVSTAIKQLSEAPGLSRQFFYSFDATNLSFARPAAAKRTPRMKVDEYEMKLIADGVKVKSKSYLPFKNGLLAIYSLPKERLVRMIAFE
ncbi:MAG TPA: hypothetical protein VGD40_09555 [Chryseosolibacter sp.]